MKSEKRQTFLSKRHISGASLDITIKITIDILAKIEKQVVTSMHESGTEFLGDPAWGLLYALWERAHDHTSAAVTLFVTHQTASSEAICRTAVESIAFLYYVSLGDSPKHLKSYFNNYFQTERKQNRQWRQSVENSDTIGEAEKAFHLESIINKEDMLNVYESLIMGEFGDEMGGDEAAKWPNIFEIFQAIGKEISYRTLYAALSSQVHSDAEDILNRFFSEGLEEITGVSLSKASKFENRIFALQMILQTVILLLEATGMYLAKYRIALPDEFPPSLRRMNKEYVRLEKEKAQFVQSVAHRINVD